MVLQNPLQERITRAFRYEFTVSNNEVKYETFIIGLYMAKDLDIKRIMVFCDFQLVVNQITDTFEAREPRMMMYLQMAKDLVSCFDSLIFNMFHEKQM